MSFDDPEVGAVVVARRRRGVWDRSWSRASGGAHRKRWRGRKLDGRCIHVKRKLMLCIVAPSTKMLCLIVNLECKVLIQQQRLYTH